MKAIIKITEILPTISGTGKDGKAWTRVSFAGETIYDSYPQTMAFDTFNEDLVKPVEALTKGQIVEVNYRINCRRNETVTNGDSIVRYFTNLAAVSVSPMKKEGENANC